MHIKKKVTKDELFVDSVNIVIDEMLTVYIWQYLYC